MPATETVGEVVAAKPAKKKAKKAQAKSLTMTRKELLAAADRTARVASSSSPAVSLTSKNCRLTMVSSDWTTSVETKVACAERHGVSAAVPANLFAQIVRACPDEKVVVEFGKDSLTVRSGDYEAVLEAKSSAPAPIGRQGTLGGPGEAPESTTVTLGAFELADGVSRVLHAASTDDSRPILTSVLFSEHEGQLRLVATDSYRLAVIDTGLAAFGTVLVPKESLVEVVKAVTEADDQIELSVAEGTLEVVTAVAKIRCRLTDGKFPEYERLIPKVESMPIRLDVERVGTIAALARTNPVTGSQSGTTIPAKIDAGKEQVAVASAAAEVGGTGEPIDATLEGTPLSFGVNPRFLAQALASFDDDRLTISAIDAKKPMVVHGDTAGHVELIMPVTIG